MMVIFFLSLLNLAVRSFKSTNLRHFAQVVLTWCNNSLAVDICFISSRTEIHDTIQNFLSYIILVLYHHDLFVLCIFYWINSYCALKTRFNRYTRL